VSFTRRYDNMLMKNVALTFERFLKKKHFR